MMELNNSELIETLERILTHESVLQMEVAIQTLVNSLKLRQGEKMVNVKEYGEAKGKYLSGDNIKASPSTLFTITEDSKIENQEQFNSRDRLMIPGIWIEEELTFSCNQTNANIIREKLGDETKEWIGAKLKLGTHPLTIKKEPVTVIDVLEVIPLSQKIGE